jgi:hypothetical protein
MLCAVILQLELAHLANLVLELKLLSLLGGTPTM